jgi:hypothetical protein
MLLECKQILALKFVDRRLFIKIITLAVLYLVGGCGGG